MAAATGRSDLDLLRVAGRPREQLHGSITAMVEDQPDTVGIDNVDVQGVIDRVGDLGQE